MASGIVFTISEEYMQINQYKNISEAEMLGEFTIWNRSPSQAVRVSVSRQAADARLL